MAQSRVLCVMGHYAAETHRPLDVTRLPEGAIVVDTTRAETVDGRALRVALVSGHVALAACRSNPSAREHAARDAMLKVFNDFERRPDLLARFDEVARCWSASCVFADVQ